MRREEALNLRLDLGGGSPDCFRGLDASELAGVLGENARRVYGLAPASLVA